MITTPWLRAAVCAAALACAPMAQAQQPPAPDWLNQALERHPTFQESHAAAQAAEARRRAAGLPLYNPEVALDVEQGEVLTLSAGISQTLDRSDRRGAAAQSAAARLEAARASVSRTRLDLAHELMHLIARYQTARDHLGIARERVRLMQRFVDISQRRLDSGDLDPTALATARLAENEARMRLAQVEAELAQVEQALALWFPDGELARLPLALPEAPPEPEELDETGLGQRLPELQALTAAHQAARAEAELRRRETRANPTVGVIAGREGDAALLGLNLSLPWQVRNPYRAEVDAALAEAEAVQARYQTALRQALERLRADSARYRILHRAWHHWLEQGRASLAGQLDALERLWSLGDLEADAYLVRLNQTLDTRERVISLRQDLWLAWFDLRYANGDLLQRLPTFRTQD